MANAAIATNFYKSFDIECNISAKITFNSYILFNIITNFGNLILRQISAASVRIDSRSFDNLSSGCSADTENIGKADFYSLIVW